VGQLEGQSALLNVLYGSSDQFGGQANYGLGSSGLSDLFPPLPSDLDYFQKKSFQVGGRLFLFRVALEVSPLYIIYSNIFYFLLYYLFSYIFIAHRDIGIPLKRKAKIEGKYHTNSKYFKLHAKKVHGQYFF
jgi:hypothetical protein